MTHSTSYSVHRTSSGLLSLTQEKMTPAHAAGWVRFQRALCNIGRKGKRYRYLLNSQRHRDAVRILGRGTEEELKAEMMLWRMDYPELFED